MVGLVLAALAATGLCQEDGLNPLLGRGRFGARQVGIKIALTGGSLAAQRYATRHRPRARRLLAVLNLAQAAALGAVAGRNWR